MNGSRVQPSVEGEAAVDVEADLMHLRSMSIPDLLNYVDRKIPEVKILAEKLEEVIQYAEDEGTRIV